MKDQCAKCRYEGNAVYGPDCRRCATTAMRRVGKLEKLIAAAIPARNDKNGPWLHCTARCRAEAARIAKRRAKEFRAKN